MQYPYPRVTRQDKIRRETISFTQYNFYCNKECSHVANIFGRLQQTILTQVGHKNVQQLFLLLHHVAVSDILNLSFLFTFQNKVANDNKNSHLMYH